MQGFHPGSYRTFTAPGGGVTAHTAVLINGTVVIPMETVAAGLPFTGFVGPGRVNGLPKVAGLGLNEGDVVRFISLAGTFGNAVLATNYPVGKCAATVLGAAATVDVYFEFTGIPGI